MKKWHWVLLAIVILFCLFVYKSWNYIEKDGAAYTIQLKQRPISLQEFEYRAAEKNAVVSDIWDKYRVIEITWESKSGKEQSELIFLKESAYEEWRKKNK